MLKRGQIDTQFTIEYLLRNIPDPNMAPVIREGVAECANEVILRKDDFNMFANLPPPPNGQRICSPLSGHFLGCIHSHFFRVINYLRPIRIIKVTFYLFSIQHCPDTRWVASKECQSLKEYFNRCPLPFPLQAEWILLIKITISIIFESPIGSQCLFFYNINNVE